MAYTVRELGRRTFADFEILAEQQGSCWCIFYQRAKPAGRGLSPAEQRRINRRDKAAFVREGRSHAILVYDGRTPVGWCQYGPREELPRIDKQRDYQGRAPQGPEKLWRITCFAVLKPYRKRGVASAALRAALEAIRRGGGGLVEAYPITRWLTRAFGNESTHGTESMFVKAGFQRVGRFGSTRYSSHVLMRKTV